MAIPNDKMEYRRLGNSGLKVSVLSFGSWVTFDNQLDTDLALNCMQAAHDAGCNFFDNAEAYAAGKSETIMGEALRELAWPRWSYVVTTKLFWGLHGTDPNMRNTLNRKLPRGGGPVPGHEDGGRAAFVHRSDRARPRRRAPRMDVHAARGARRLEPRGDRAPDHRPLLQAD